MTREGVSYSDAGVDYEALDAGKRLAMALALSTSPLLAGRGARAIDASRGEPAFAFELGGRTLAFVVEGLGTKSIVARQVLEQQGIDRFADVAYDTVAAIVNDLCCVGALPLVVNAYFATGASQWYRERARAASLLEGWRRACSDAGCAWGGGESPSLPGLVDEREIELAGAAVGAVPEGRAAILGEALGPGDEIVLVASSGLHANGASLARLLAGRLPDGYATALGSGRTLGEALLEPSVMYVGLVAELLQSVAAVDVHQPYNGSRPAQADAPAAGAEIPDSEAAGGARGVELARRGGRTGAEGGLLDVQHGRRPRPVLRGRDGRSRSSIWPPAWAYAACVAGVVEEGPREVVLEPIGVRLHGGELELSA